jgi:RNA polymerase primary sigma factor
LLSNEEKIYHSYRGTLDTAVKKQEMLHKVQENRDNVSETIQSIKIANKLIRRFGQRLDKTFAKIKEKEQIISSTHHEIEQLGEHGLLTPEKLSHREELLRTMRIAQKSLKKVDQELGLSRSESIRYYHQLQVGQRKDKRAKDDLARANLRLVV